MLYLCCVALILRCLLAAPGRRVRAGLEGMDEVETVLALPAVTETTLRLRRHRAILRTMAMDPWGVETDIANAGKE